MAADRGNEFTYGLEKSGTGFVDVNFQLKKRKKKGYTKGRAIEQSLSTNYWKVCVCVFFFGAVALLKLCFLLTRVNVCIAFVLRKLVRCRLVANACAIIYFFNPSSIYNNLMPI